MEQTAAKRPVGRPKGSVTTAPGRSVWMRLADFHRMKDHLRAKGKKQGLADFLGEAVSLRLAQEQALNDA